MSHIQKKFAKSCTRRTSIAARSRQNDERNSNAKSAQPAGSLVDIVPGIRVCGRHLAIPFKNIHGWEDLSGGSNSKNQATNLLPITQVICYKSESEKYYPLVKRDLLMPELREAGYTHIVVFVITNFHRLTVSKQQQVRAYLQFVAPGRGLFRAPKIFENIRGSTPLQEYFKEIGIADPLSYGNINLLCCGMTCSATIARMRKEFGVVDSERTARGRAAFAKKITNDIVDCIPLRRGIQRNPQRELKFK